MVKGPVIRFSIRPVPREELERLLEEHVELRHELFINIQEIEEIVGESYEKVVREYVTKASVPISKRMKNAAGLRFHIKSLLEDHPEGLTIDQIASNLLLGGYKTSSKDFPGQCYRTIRRLTEKEEEAGVPTTFWYDSDDKVWRVD